MAKEKLPKKEEQKKRLVLLDAHAIIHRAYHALPEFTSSKGEPTGALYGISAMLMKIIADLKPDYIAACYDLPGKTFRHEAYGEYKARRKKADDALISQLKRSRDIFESFNIPMYDHPGFEADDMLGTIVEKLKKEKNEEIVIASGDMDTLQLIDGKKVQVYTLKKGINDTVMYDEKGVVDRFGFPPELLPDYKGLRGDPSDNIIGVPGIGEKTATILIQNFGTIENIYKALKKDKEAFKKIGVTERIIKILEENEEEAHFSKTLATIRRDAPIDFKLPKESWRKSFDIGKAKATFKEFEFKSLGDRLEKLFNQPDEKKEGSSGAEESAESADEGEIKKISIALWLLNSDLTTPSLSDILEYAGTSSFAEAKEKILKEIKEKKLDYVYEKIELPLIPIIKKAEDYGVRIDIEYMKKLSDEYHKTLSALEKGIYKLAGSEFNINSPKQLGEVLFDILKLTAKGLKKTAGGARSTRESELEKLKDSHPIIEKILDYRELQKLLSTYVDTIPKMVDSKHRLHTTLNQAGTTTGRMSSNNPNLQNIPVRGDYGNEVRKGFISAPRHKWIACDYSQIEMRVLALLSGDENLIEMFRLEKDVHSGVASFVFGVPENKVTPDMRRQAKVINFGIVYGMGVNALRANLESTREEAQIFYDNYFKAFPKIRNYFEKVKKEAMQKGYTETLFGRRRYFPGLKSRIPYVKAMAERMAVNAPLQGTAADIIKIAMREVDEELAKAGLGDNAHLLLQVHDELIYEAEDAIVEKARDLIKKVMEAAVESRLVLSANVSVGKNWGEME